MSYDDNTLTNKISSLIQTQLPEFIQADHPVFNQFVRSYFQFLESAEITVSEVNNYLVQDTTSVNFVLDEDGEKVVLDSDIGDIDYEKGELKMYNLTIIKGSFFDNRISVRVKPLLNDVKALREVYLDVDVANSSFTAYKE